MFIAIEIGCVGTFSEKSGFEACSDVLLSLLLLFFECQCQIQRYQMCPETKILYFEKSQIKL
jgi:hypothetical protein